MPLPDILLSQDLTSRNDFVLREHFEDYRRRINPRFNTRTLGRAFNYLIDTSEGRCFDNEVSDGISPFEGLVVDWRENLGIEPYTPIVANIGARSRVLANYAIQAGSLIDARPSIASHFASVDAKYFTLGFTNLIAVKLL